MTSHRHHLEHELARAHAQLRIATTPGDPYARPELAGELERRIDALETQLSELAEAPPAEVDDQLELGFGGEVARCE